MCLHKMHDYVFIHVNFTECVSWVPMSVMGCRSDLPLIHRRGVRGRANVVQQLACAETFLIGRRVVPGNSVVAKLIVDCSMQCSDLPSVHVVLARPVTQDLDQPHWGPPATAADVAALMQSE